MALKNEQNTGNNIPATGSLIGTIAYGLEYKKVSYAVEGSIFSAGSSIDWMKIRIPGLSLKYT